MAKLGNKVKSIHIAPALGVARLLAKLHYLLVELRIHVKSYLG